MEEKKEISRRREELHHELMVSIYNTSIYKINKYVYYKFDLLFDVNFLTF